MAPAAFNEDQIGEFQVKGRAGFIPVAKVANITEPRDGPLTLDKASPVTLAKASCIFISIASYNLS